MSRLEKLREKKLKAAEKKAGIVDGNTYRIRIDGHSGSGYKFVRVRYRFYPVEKWVVCDVDFFGDERETNHRTLDDETKSKLETWL